MFSLDGDTVNYLKDAIRGGIHGISALPALVFSTSPLRRQDDVTPPENGRQYRQMAFGAIIAFGLSSVGGLVGGFVAMTAKMGTLETTVLDVKASVRDVKKDQEKLTDRFNDHAVNHGRTR